VSVLLVNILVMFLDATCMHIYGVHPLKYVSLAGFGAPSVPSAFGTNFGLASGATAFGQTQNRPATCGAAPFSTFES